MIRLFFACGEWRVSWYRWCLSDIKS